MNNRTRVTALATIDGDCPMKFTPVNGGADLELELGLDGLFNSGMNLLVADRAGQRLATGILHWLENRDQQTKKDE